MSEIERGSGGFQETDRAELRNREWAQQLRAFVGLEENLNTEQNEPNFRLFKLDAYESCWPI